MRNPHSWYSSNPAARKLFTLSAVSCALAAAIVLTGAAPQDSVPNRRARSLVAPADTDSVVVNGILVAVSDSLAIDSLTVDSLASDSVRARKYIPLFRRPNPNAALVDRPIPPMMGRLPQKWSRVVELDSTSGNYVAREKVGETDVRSSVSFDRSSYRSALLRKNLDENWQELIAQREQQRKQRRRGGLGFNIVVPGGREGAFTTIFGKPTVSLRVNGNADIKAGFNYQESDQQSILGKRSQIDPEFKQDLQLGINGSIGDKMQINVNYDTQNRFDFENKLELKYTGYEDEIVQSIEAGNVLLSTPSKLIRGGQSLFGIKSEFQIGGVHLTTVMSQQEGQASSKQIQGGSETTPFAIKPIDYDDGRHFFLGYYFRNRWENALSDPPRIILANGFERITEIEVWRFELTSPDDDDVREVVAMVDMGEDANILDLANGYTSAGPSDLPGANRDQYSEADLQLLRDRNQSADTFLGGGGKGLNERSDFQTGPFRKLERGRDYTVDDQLGYISLNQRLQDSEAIAVAYRYIAGGTVLQVGDLSTGTGGADENTRLVLKLIRPRNPEQPGVSNNPAAWYLELRNIYSIGGRQLNPSGFELNVEYARPGQAPQTKIPQLGGQRTLLDLLGLDRLTQDGAPGSDEIFDYRPGFNIVPSKGILIFPYLEPFGKRIADIAAENETDGTEFVFSELYRQKKENARNITKYNIYQIAGEYKGSVASTYDLNSFSGIVPGSIRVTSAGAELTENVDYIVDYTGGSVTITNDAYLIEGRDIDISFEQNSFLQIQKKTLLGLRADYDLDERLSLGATGMRLSEKSPTDKFRIGEEPISNFIWGVDGAWDSEASWLTRAIDKIPLLQTRQDSRISLSGEFAQLRPGHTQTQAFSRSRRDLRKDGRDFNGDELDGISYLDDFEGFENTLPLMQPGSWRIPSAPDSIRAVSNTEPKADSLRTNWRASFAWYRINNNTLSEIDAAAYDPNAVRTIEIDEVYPDRELNGQTDRTLSTLDIYLNPHERGPYNYTKDLAGFINNPTDTWGGMVQRIPDGYNDFGLKNIEFVEFIFQPFSENSANLADVGAQLNFDLGFISEDVLPDERLNEEDGLSTSVIEPSAISTWGRLPTTLRDKVVKLDDTNGRTEDVGIDGLASYGGDYPEFATEAFHFSDFLNSLDPANSNPYYAAERARSILDPSADDYHYFGDDNFFKNPDYFPGGSATVQQRFARFFAGFELNAFESQRELAGLVDVAARRGNSKYPDSEDLNNNSAPDLLDSYYQYTVPLNRDELDRQATPTEVNDYVVTEITSQAGEKTGWYQVRIPVREFTRKVGSIQDFTRIESMRVWMTGVSDPITVRFASMELVGSQWRKGESIPLYDEDPLRTIVGDEPQISISSVNNEENSSVYLPPRGTIIAETRLANGQRQASREQAMVLRTQDLGPGQQLAIFKPYTQGLDLLKYSNLRMFAHAHGTMADGTVLENLSKVEGRSKARFFIRFGANETDDYYEYEQPLTPSSEVSGNADDLWQTDQLFDGETLDLNSINIEMSAFNQLKVERDQRGAARDSVFWNELNGVIRGPDATVFAPPGTRLAIKGTPSLGRINTIVMGIRNPSSDTLGLDPANIIEDLTVWINEMRVAGYDESNGWSAIAAAQVKIADLGSIDARFSTQTDGFGGLSSTLDDREQNNLQSWSVTSTLNLDQPIPERFGWSIPVTMQTSSNVSEPRFSPSTGDIRIDDIIKQIGSRSDLSSEEIKDRQSYVREASATKRSTRSISARISKSGSRSVVLRNTLDGLSASYSYSTTDASNPSQSLQDDWKWTTTLGYRFNSRKPRTIRPFGPLDGIPVVGVLGKLRFNYLPQSISLNASANRSYGVTQDRTPSLTFERDESVQNFLDNPLRQRHSFSLSKTTSWQYNPFQFLNLGLDTNTGQSLNALGVRSVFYAYDLESDTRFLVADTSGANLPIQEEIAVKPAFDVLSQAVNGSDLFRTNQHTQRFNATLRTNFTKSKALNFIQLQDVAYSAQYQWNNGSEGRNDGAAISNQYDIRTGMSIKVQEFWRKFKFYRNLEEAQKNAERQAETERKAREAARKAAKEEKERRKEEERAAREAAREAERLGVSDTTAVNPATIDSVAVDPLVPDSTGQGGVLDPNGNNLPTDSTAVVSDAAKRRSRDGAAADAKSDEPDAGPRFHFPLPNPVSILRRTALALTGIRDLSITYTGSHSARSSNIGEVQSDGTVLTPYSLFDRIFNGEGPSLKYRFGFTRTGDDARVFNESLQISDVFTDAHRFQGRTALNPTKALTVNLSWQADLSQTQTATLRSANDRTETISGTNKASVWVFSPNYVDLVQKQLDTFFADGGLAGGSGTISDSTGNNDGRVVLTNASVVHDFREVYGNSNVTIDGKNLLPLPLPNWTVTYNGLGKWPLIRSIVQSATVRHTYSADYSSDFRTNSIAALNGASTESFTLNNNTVVFRTPKIETGSVRVNRRFSPLIGFDFTLKSRLQTNIGWNKSNSYSLSTSNFDISENSTSEITASITYQKTGFKIPFFKKKLNNRVSFTISFARSTTLDRRFHLRKALVEAASDPDFTAAMAVKGDLVSEITSNIRTTISPQVSYTFSNRVQANFVLRYVDFQGDTRQPSNRNINGTFNIRVNISDR